MTATPFKLAQFILLSLLTAFSLSAYAGVNVGKPAPDFTGVDSNGNQHSLSQYKGKTVVLEWTNHDCPYVKKHYNSGNMQTLQKQRNRQWRCLVIHYLIQARQTGACEWQASQSTDPVTQRRTNGGDTG